MTSIRQCTVWILWHLPALPSDDSCNCMDSCKRDVYGVKLSYAETTGLMLPHVNVTALKAKVTKGISLKHRLEVTEFEKTLNLLEALEDSINQLSAYLNTIMTDQSPPDKIRFEEYAFHLSIIADMTRFFEDVDSYSVTYKAHTEPFIQRSISAVTVANTHMTQLQNDVMDSIRHMNLSTTFSSKRIDTAVALLEDAIHEIHSILQWPDYSDHLAYEFHIGLNKYLFVEKYDHDCCSVDYTADILLTINVLKNASQVWQSPQLDHSGPSYLLFSSGGLVPKLIKNSEILYQCLNQYGILVEDGKLLSNTILENLGIVPKPQIDSALTKHLRSLLFFTQKSIVDYFENKTTKEEMPTGKYNLQMEEITTENIQGRLILKGFSSSHDQVALGMRRDLTEGATKTTSKL